MHMLLLHPSISVKLARSRIASEKVNQMIEVGLKTLCINYSRLFIFGSLFDSDLVALPNV